MRRHRCSKAWIKGLLLALTPAMAHATDFTWSATNSDNYNVGTRWTPTGPPGVGDNATIDVTGSAYTVTLNDARSINNFMLNSVDAKLLHLGGTYTVMGTLAVSSGAYQIQGGTINGGSITQTNTGTFTVQGNNTTSTLHASSFTGTMNWSGDFGARMVLESGSVLNSGTQLNIFTDTSIPGFTFLGVNQTGSLGGAGVTINLLGRGVGIALMGSNSMTLAAGAVINASQHMAGASYQEITGGASSSFTNNGTIQALAGNNGQLYISVGGTFTNNGTMTLQAGAMVVNPGTLVNNQNITTTGGTLSLVPTSSATYTNNQTLTASGGTTPYSGGWIIINPTGSFVNTGALAADTGGAIMVQRNLTTTQLGNFSSTGNGTINLYGTMTLDNTGSTLTLDDTTRSLTLLPIYTQVGATIIGGSITTSGSAKLLAGGTGINGVHTLQGVNFTGAMDLVYGLTGGSTAGEVRLIDNAGIPTTLGSNTTIRVMGDPTSNFPSSPVLGIGQTDPLGHSTINTQIVLTGRGSSISGEGAGPSTTRTITFASPLTINVTDLSAHYIGSNFLGGQGTVNITNQGTINQLAGSGGARSLAIEPNGTFTNAGAINGEYGSITSNAGNFINTGSVNAYGGTSAYSGGKVFMGALGTINNLGSMTASQGGAIFYSSNLTTAQLGNFSSSGNGTVNLWRNITLDNSNAVLNLNDTTGSLSLSVDPNNFSQGVTVVGGAINTTGAAKVIVNGSGISGVHHFQGVTFTGNLEMTHSIPGFSQPSYLVLKENNGVPTTLGSNTTVTVGGEPTGNFSNWGTTLGIAQTDELGNSTMNTKIVLTGRYSSMSGEGAGTNTTRTVTFAPELSILVTSRSGHYITSNALEGQGTVHIQNKGLISLPVGDGNARDLTINPNGDFINSGTVQVDFGTAYLSPGGSVVLNAGSQLKTTGTGQIVITSSSVTNNGTVVNSSGSTLSIGGGTGTLTNNSFVDISGTLDSSLIVTSTGTLIGTGTITRSVTVNGIINPGHSPGSVTVSQGLTLNGEYQWDLGTNTTTGPGVNFDQIRSSSGNVTVTGAAILRLNLINNTLIDPFWAANHEWIIIDNIASGNLLTGVYSSSQIITAQQPNGVFDTFIGGTDNNDLILRWTYVAIPEPTTWMMIILGIGAFTGGGVYGWRCQQKALQQFVNEDQEDTRMAA